MSQARQEWRSGYAIGVQGGGVVSAEVENGRRYWAARYKLSYDEFCSAEDAIAWCERKAA